ncbi:putative reverse transcriptase domain-containing protein [Tanacetum coccineum]
MLVDMSGAPATDDIEFGRRMTEFTIRVRQDTNEIYTRLDEHSERQLIAGRLNMLIGYHAQCAYCRQHGCPEARKLEMHGDDHWIERPSRTQMTEFERQHGPAKGPTQPDAPEEAGSSTIDHHGDADRNTNGDDSHISERVVEGQNTFPRIQRVKASLRTPQGTLRTNNNNRTRGRTLAGLLLQGLVKRSHTGDLNSYAQSATITTMVHVLPNATNATKLAILPVTVEVRQMPTMLTTRRALVSGSPQEPTCYECGVQGHFKRECPKLKNNNNRGNQVGGGNAPAKVYAVGHARTNPDSNVMTGTFLLNNRYASILFDTGADRSFLSTAFSSQIDITPTALDHYYDVELADRRIIGFNTILRVVHKNI